MKRPTKPRAMRRLPPAAPAPTSPATATPPPAAVAVPATYAEHLRQTVDLILQGYSVADIHQHLTDAGHQPADLIAAAAAHFAEAAMQPRLSQLGFCLEATRDLYRRALEIGDFDTSLRALAQLEKISAQIVTEYEPAT